MPLAWQQSASESGDLPAHHHFQRFVRHLIHVRGDEPRSAKCSNDVGVVPEAVQLRQLLADANTFEWPELQKHMRRCISQAFNIGRGKRCSVDARMPHSQRLNRLHDNRILIGNNNVQDTDGRAAKKNHIRGIIEGCALASCKQKQHTRTTTHNSTKHARVCMGVNIYTYVCVCGLGLGVGGAFAHR